MMTFEVDAVEESRYPPPTQPLGREVRDALWMAPGPETRVVDPEGAHPLLAAVHRAFAEHRPLVLSPDVVWLTLAQGVAQHVRLNSEALRSRLVRHEGRKTLLVQVEALPTDGPAIQSVVSAFREQLRGELGPGLPRLLSCDFSTSTDIERLAGDVVLMDTFSAYFDYVLACVCGIPRITLLGTPEDWRSIRRRIDVIAELDLGWWTASLVPIADEWVRTAEGQPDIGFWREIYKPRKSYGWDRITGWIARLFPYIGGAGRFDERNPLLAQPHAELMASLKEEDESRWYSGPGLILDKVPAGLSSVPLEVKDYVRDARETWALEAGVLAVEVDGAGALVPRAGVIVRRGTASIAQVIERILAGHEATRATQAGGFQGRAELNALYDHLGRATLFPQTRPWRLRALEEHDEIHIPLTHQRTRVVGLVDLPDGTVLALRTGPPRRPLVILRLRADQLEPLPPDEEAELRSSSPEEGARRCLLSRERAEDIPVVGTSLAAVLTHALDHEGATDLPVLGTLAGELQPWEDMPPPERPASRKKRGL